MYDNIMMPPENQFNSSMISGKWIDKRNGNVIEVRDAIQDGDVMLLITNNGQIDMSEFTQFYIQASDEIYDEHGNVIGNSQATNIEVTTGYDIYQNTNKREINNILKEQEINKIETNNFDINKPISNDVEQTEDISSIENVFTTQKKIKLNNYDIINKFFNKIETKPEINLTISWTDIPLQEIKTLINYLDVSKEDISAYIYNEYLQNSSSDLQEQITNYINELLVSDKNIV